MTLEPTPEQLMGLSVHANVTIGVAHRLWPLIRDMVLEEAVERLDALETWDEVSVMGHAVVRACDVYKAMQALIAMKGPKP